MKVPKIPKCFYSQICTVYFESGQRDKYGQRQKAARSFACRFTPLEKELFVVKEGKRQIGTVLRGIALVDGKEELGGCDGCVAEIKGKKYIIHSCKGVIQPNGEIHHWRLEII